MSQVTLSENRSGITKDDLRELSCSTALMIEGLEERGKSLIIVLEGLDAAGKSGCAKCIAKRADPSHIRIVHTGAPTAEELTYNYLYRFWRDIPPTGSAAVFDRSWYGRVLVERVEELCSRSDWERAYGEMCAFEEFLTSNGAVIEKFWLDIPPEVQLERFMRRMSDPSRRYKLTEDDWRGRLKRREYDAAAEDMLRRTDTQYAPWTVVPAADKRAARAAVLRRIISRVESR